MVSVIATSAAIVALKPSGPALYALAIIPAIPIALIFVVLGRYLNAVDEFVRARAVRAMMIAGAIVLSVVTAWDFLRVYADAPAMPPFVVGPGFFLVMGLAQMVQGFAFRSDGDEA